METHLSVEGAFDAARQLDAKRVEVRAMLRARPAKKAKKAKAALIVATYKQTELL